MRDEFPSVEDMTMLSEFGSDLVDCEDPEESSTESSDRLPCFEWTDTDDAERKRIQQTIIAFLQPLCDLELEIRSLIERKNAIDTELRETLAKIVAGATRENHHLKDEEEDDDGATMMKDWGIIISVWRQKSDRWFDRTVDPATGQYMYVPDDVSFTEVPDEELHVSLLRQRTIRVHERLVEEKVHEMISELAQVPPERIIQIFKAESSGSRARPRSNRGEKGVNETMAGRMATVFAWLQEHNDKFRKLKSRFEWVQDAPYLKWIDTFNILPSSLRTERMAVRCRKVEELQAQSDGIRGRLYECSQRKRNALNDIPHSTRQVMQSVMNGQSEGLTKAKIRTAQKQVAERSVHSAAREMIRGELALGHPKHFLSVPLPAGSNVLVRHCDGYHRPRPPVGKIPELVRQATTEAFGERMANTRIVNTQQWQALVRSAPFVDSLTRALMDCFERYRIDHAASNPRIDLRFPN